MEERLEKIVKEYGSPLYVYDSDIIAQKFKQFKNAFSVNDLMIHFAAKALSNLSILKLFRNLGAGLDCVSPEEIKLGIMAGFKPEDIIFTPNGVSIDEYDEALRVGTKITIDSLPALEKLGYKRIKSPVFIRINPHLNAGGNNKIRVGHIDSKFGISIHQIPLVLRLVKRYKINVEGIHIHTGSDIIDPDIFERVAELVFSVADNFDNIKSLDFGSGLKVKYRENDLSTDVDDLGKKFSKLFNEYCDKRGKDICLRFEPGKFLVSEAGYFLAKVNFIKQTTACNFAAINSGFNHFIRPMFYDAFHEIENISNPKGEEKMYSVTGYICESDTFAEDRLIREIREGDILMFRNAGAYCYSMSSNYNSRTRPAEVLLYKGKDYLIRKREDFEDITKNQVVPDFLK